MTLRKSLATALLTLAAAPVLAHTGPEQAGFHFFEHMLLVGGVAAFGWIAFRLWRARSGRQDG